MNKETFKKDFMLISMIVFSVVVWLTGLFIAQNKMSWTLGIAFGLIFSLLKLKLMEKTISKAVLLPPGKAKNYMNAQYTVRYILTGIVLVVAALEPSVSLVGVFFGLMSMKIGAYAQLAVKQDNKVE